MTYLINTQILIWFQTDKNRLSSSNYEILRSGENQILVSHVSIFEIVIKRAIGKFPEITLSVPELVSQIKTDGFEILPTTETHLAAYEQIPLLNDHRDPFDRLLIATAQAEAVPLISADEKFKSYPAGVFTLIEN